MPHVPEDRLEHIARELDEAAVALTTMERRTSARPVVATELAADEDGLPGTAGRELHTLLTAVLRARARETAGLVHRLTDSARTVRSCLRQYAATDEAARHRFAGDL